MRRTLKWACLLAACGLAAWSFYAWPRLDRVETGQTPQYPDLQPHRYAARPDKVAAAVQEVAKALPHWTVRGAGAGSAGAELQLVHGHAWLPLEERVFVRARSQAGVTVVSVRSQSSFGPMDFGQNARNVRALLAALDARLR